MAVGKIDRYELDGTLGEGAYGTVYRAYDAVLDRTVAIKLLNKETGADPQTSLVEAKTLAKLRHPNIVTLYEISEYDGQIAMVMEYLDGVPLRNYLRDESLPLEEKLSVARQVADALKASHALGIVHADIKPGNIIMRTDGVPVLVDFGLAKRSPTAHDMETLTKGSLGQSLILGTLPYMAPEVMKGGKPDEVSDIFSFGAVFYEILTGERAFKAASDAEIVHLILNEDPSPVSVHAPDVPPWCSNLVARMLSKERSARPQSFEDVLKAIDAEDAGTPMKDRNAARAAAQKARRAGRMKGAMVAALILVAAGGGYWGATQWDGEPLTVSGQLEAGMDRLRHSQEKGAIADAKARFEHILLEDPENAAATAGYSLALSLEYANVEADPKTLKDAKAAAELALTLDDQLALAHAAGGWAYEFSGERDKAKRAYTEAFELDPTNYFALLGAGRSLMVQGDLSSAIREYEKAVEIYPNDGWFITLLGDLYYRKGHFDEAERAVQKGISLASDNIHAYRTLSAILFAKGNTLEAIAAAQKGLQVRPDPMLYNNLGSFYFSLGQYAQSASAFERAIDAQGNSHNYLLWANLGDAFSMIPGKEEDRKLAYRRAIQLLSVRIKPDEKRPTLLSRAGLYYAKAGQIDEARAMTDRALTLAPTNRYVLFRASVVLEQAGDRAGALRLVEQSMDAGQPLSEIQNEPYLATLRQDPAYHKMIAARAEEQGRQ